MADYFTKTVTHHRRVEAGHAKIMGWRIPDILSVNCFHHLNIIRSYARKPTSPRENLVRVYAPWGGMSQINLPSGAQPSCAPIWSWLLPRKRITLPISPTG